MEKLVLRTELIFTLKHLKKVFIVGQKMLIGFQVIELLLDRRHLTRLEILAVFEYS